MAVNQMAPPTNPSVIRPLKFAAQLHRLTVRHNESKLYDMMVRVNRRERHRLHVSALRASDDVEKTELDRLPVRRYLPLQACPIPGVTIVGREETIPVHVKHRD